MTSALANGRFAESFRIKDCCSGIALGPNQERHFECGDIQDILVNLNAFEAAIKAGQFWVYGFGNEQTYDVTFSHIVLLVVLAAGL